MAYDKYAGRDDKPRVPCPNCDFDLYGENDVFIELHTLGYCHWENIAELMDEDFYNELMDEKLNGSEFMERVGLLRDATREETKAWVLRQRLHK